MLFFFFFFSSRRRHTRCSRDWSSDVCSSDLDLQYVLTKIDVIENARKYFVHQRPFPAIRRADPVVYAVHWFPFGRPSSLLGTWARLERHVDLTHWLVDAAWL